MTKVTNEFRNHKSICDTLVVQLLHTTPNLHLVHLLTPVLLFVIIVLSLLLFWQLFTFHKIFLYLNCVKKQSKKKKKNKTTDNIGNHWGEKKKKKITTNSYFITANWHWYIMRDKLGGQFWDFDICWNCLQQQNTVERRQITEKTKKKKSFISNILQNY